MFQVVTKLKLVKRALKEWIHMKPRINEQVQIARSDRDISQILLQKSNSDYLVAKEKEAKLRLDSLLLIEVDTARQKARATKIIRITFFSPMTWLKASISVRALPECVSK